VTIQNRAGEAKCGPFGCTKTTKTKKQLEISPTIYKILPKHECWIFGMRILFPWYVNYIQNIRVAQPDNPSFSFCAKRPKLSFTL
jgi:hypothetical protein